MFHFFDIVTIFVVNKGIHRLIFPGDCFEQLLIIVSGVPLLRRIALTDVGRQEQGPRILRLLTVELSQLRKQERCAAIGDAWEATVTALYGGRLFFQKLKNLPDFSGNVHVGVEGVR